MGRGGEPEKWCARQDLKDWLKYRELLAIFGWFPVGVFTVPFFSFPRLVEIMAKRLGRVCHPVSGNQRAG
jgi:hypothetical protein